jgi:hypothetical protein
MARLAKVQIEPVIEAKTQLQNVLVAANAKLQASDDQGTQNDIPIRAKARFSKGRAVLKTAPTSLDAASVQDPFTRAGK